MADRFDNYVEGLTAPPGHGEEIAPDDVAPLLVVTRAIYVGGTGHMRVELKSGAIVTFSNVQAGVVYPLRVVKVLATGTTATNLVGVS